MATLTLDESQIAKRTTEHVLTRMATLTLDESQIAKRTTEHMLTRMARLTLDESQIPKGNKAPPLQEAPGNRDVITVLRQALPIWQAETL
jgi:hypothetical protein